MDYAANDFASIAQRMKELREEQDAAVKGTVEASKPEAPASPATPQPSGDYDSAWDYGCYWG